MLGCTITLLVLLLLDHLHSHIVLWIVTLCFGFFMGPIFATAFSLPSEYNIEVNSRAVSIMVGKLEIKITFV